MDKSKVAIIKGPKNPNEFDRPSDTCLYLALVRIFKTLNNRYFTFIQRFYLRLKLLAEVSRLKVIVNSFFIVSPPLSSVNRKNPQICGDRTIRVSPIQVKAMITRFYIMANGVNRIA